MDTNIFGLIRLVGNLIRLVFIFKFNFNKQTEASENNFEEQENKDLKVGAIFLALFIIFILLVGF